jgi:metallo-beta-lactamase family protein
LVSECTYGNRVHGTFEDIEQELAELVNELSASGGKMIVPSFAVGRTQLLVYLLHKLFNQNRIPEIPIFVDSPLAVHATEIFRNYPEYLDRETVRVFLDGHEDPFGFRRLKYISDVKDSKQLNGLSYPHIIISASGMAEGGRILHHLKNNIDNPKCILLFVGYAAQHTLARKIMDGEEYVKIFGEEHRVRARIKKMEGFSAHADQRGLLEYITMSRPDKLKHLFLVHGEPDGFNSLSEELRTMGYSNIKYPAPGERAVIT